MAFTIGNQNATTNGTTPVEIVAAPGTDEYRIIKTITVHNKDTAAKEFELQLVEGASTYEIARSGNISAGASWSFTNALCLDATNKSLKIVLTAAKTTNDCPVTAHFLTEA